MSSNLPRRNSAIQKIRTKLSTIENVLDATNLLYKTLVEFQYPDKNIGKDLKIYDSPECDDDIVLIDMSYKDQDNRIISFKGIEKKRPKIKWLQSLIEESGWLDKLNEVSESYCEDNTDAEENEYELMIELINKYDFRADRVVNTKEELNKIGNKMIKLFQQLSFKNNRLYLFELMLQFFLFNKEILWESFNKSIINKIEEIVNQGDTSIEIYRFFFDGSMQLIDIKHLSQDELFELILNDKKYSELNEVEIKLLEKRLMSLERIPDKIQELLLDLNDDNREIIVDDTRYLDDEIDNAIRPRGEFVPDPTNLSEVDPEYDNQFQNWVLDNNVVLDEVYIPEDPDAELELKDEFETKLMQNITSNKQKLIRPNLRKIISTLDCNNEVDPITLDTITKKNYLELKWIIILDESGKVGDCFNKEDLIRSMHENPTFGPYPSRDNKFYKEPLKGVWVDEAGLKNIPKSKIVQLKQIGKEKIGTRFGISTIHGEEEKIYTLVKLF